MIKPYLPTMTPSELHAVMTGGFATIAGSVLAAYVSFGVDPSHLLSASVMSAPAALAYAKLFYPGKASLISFFSFQFCNLKYFSVSDGKTTITIINYRNKEKQNNVGQN